MTYFRINPVLALLLLLTAIAAALPFISYAPNRLVSGEGRHLWQLWPQTIWMLVGVGCAWLTACFIPAKKGSIFALILAQFVFVLLVWGAGKAATQLAQNGSALARTSLGSGFWLAAALALLACSDAIRRISTHPLWRWLLHMQIAIVPLWLLYSGTLNDLSLMKEYANRQDVFDDALAQHLTLLFGAVLPALVIGVPLGIWCYFSTARQGAIFSLLNVIQTVPSVALFGLLIAPLAALVTAFPWLGKLGIAGTGMTPALIALVLYALLPLVRGVVVGLNQIPRDVLESARAMGMSGAQRFGVLLGEHAAQKPDIPLRILGPAPMNITMLNNKFRYKLTLKCRNDAAFRALLHETLDAYDAEKLPQKASVILDFNSDGDL